ncbi:histidine phosphatase family protein [Pseudomonas viridiflava]|uniref:histidine phosphatase family protein n=1 Tax=Pseudomonas viridiflava TaxID=33069 RepID=UPI002EAB3B85|nr:histidine phosphatase family protein [Pseudomonas viridiflava]
MALTDLGNLQADKLAASLSEAPVLIISSPFERALHTARPTALRFPEVPMEIWQVEEFTYLSPGRFTGTTQADRKPAAVHGLYARGPCNRTGLRATRQRLGQVSPTSIDGATVA